jgi:hypothetical protein
MKNKNEKGFALVLSLVLLLVMSLMGGALIVISAGDHQSNNTSDQYQQTFYVAETSLLEGEKYLLNQFLGPYKNDGTRDLTLRNLPANGATVYNGAMTKKNYISTDNFNAETGNICYNSFPDIDRTELKVVVAESWNFGKIIRDSFNTNASHSEIKEAENHLQKFYYEFFIARIGAAPFRGYGSSVKKTATNTGNDGMAYRIYGCGMFKEKKGAPLNKISIVIPLESTIVLPR